MQIDILLVNALAYFFTLLFAIYKFKRLNLYVLIWLAYSIVTYMGYYSVKENMHYSGDVNLGYKLEIIPYICAYFTIVLLTYPFYRMDERNINWNINIPQKLVKLIYFVSFLFVIQTIFNGIAAYIISQTIGIGEAYVGAHEGDYSNVIGNNLLNRILHYSEVLTNALQPFYVIYFFIQMQKRHGSFWKNIFMIMLAFMPTIFSAIAGGSKGALFFVSFELIFFYLLIRPSLSSDYNIKITLIGSIIGLIIIFYVIVITLSRFEAIHGVSANNKQQQNEIVHYLGESYPNLGYFYYGKVYNHPNGRRFFLEFFEDNPEEKYKYSGLDSKFDYWENITHVSMAVFKTFWGDWYLEYGFWGSFIGIILIFLFFYKFWIKDYNKFYNIGIISFYYTNIIIQGCFTGSGLEGSQKHNTLLLLIVVSIYIKINSKYIYSNERK